MNGFDALMVVSWLLLLAPMAQAQTLETWSCESYGSIEPVTQQWTISDDGIQQQGREISTITWKLAKNDDQMAVCWKTVAAYKEIPALHLAVILDKETGTLVEIAEDVTVMLKSADDLPVIPFVYHCARKP
jgi:hypothetical protein